MQPTIFFVDNLTAAIWVMSVIPRLLWARWLYKWKVHQCYVIDGSRAALIFAILSGYLFGIRVERLVFRLVEIHDDQGTSANLQITYQQLDDTKRRIMESQDYRRLAGQYPYSNRLGLYIEKSIASGGPGVRGTMGHAQYVIRVCALKFKALTIDVPKAFLFLERIPWIDYLDDYADQFNIEIVAVRPPLKFKSYIRRKLPRKIEYLLQAGRHNRSFFASLLASAWPFKVNRSIDNNSSFNVEPEQTVEHSCTNEIKVAVDIYIGALNLDYSERRSELFFWQQSPIKAENLLVTYGNPHIKLDEVELDGIKDHGITGVVLHPGATTVPFMPVMTPSRSSTRTKIAGSWSNGRKHEQRWLRYQTDKYHRTKEYWYEIFKKYNAKVYVTEDKYSDTHVAIADAVMMNGGVSAVYQRAYESNSSPITAVGSDVYFAFSPQSLKIESASGSRYQYHITTGYLGDHRFPLLIPLARSIRETLMQNGANYIMAFFDENSLEDERWHSGHDNMRDNYIFLLNKVLTEPWFGLVIKPKTPGTLISRLGDVSELLSLAESTGRCYVFHSATTGGMYTPAAASLAADIAVHSSLHGATAGLEAALAGTPTLLLDQNRWSSSPLYKLNVGKVVFEDWVQIWEAFAEARRNDGISNVIGDWSPILSEIDPFRDGRAAERMGTFIHWLIEGFARGLDRSEVMSRAADQYSQMWGADTVVKFDGIFHGQNSA